MVVSDTDEESSRSAQTPPVNSSAAGPSKGKRVKGGRSSIASRPSSSGPLNAREVDSDDESTVEIPRPKVKTGPPIGAKRQAPPTKVGPPVGKRRAIPEATDSSDIGLASTSKRPVLSNKVGPPRTKKPLPSVEGRNSNGAPSSTSTTAKETIVERKRAEVTHKDDERDSDDSNDDEASGVSSADLRTEYLVVNADSFLTKPTLQKSFLPDPLPGPLLASTPQSPKHRPSPPLLPTLSRLLYPNLSLYRTLSIRKVHRMTFRCSRPPPVPHHLKIKGKGKPHDHLAPSPI